MIVPTFPLACAIVTPLRLATNNPVPMIATPMTAVSNTIRRRRFVRARRDEETPTEGWDAEEEAMMEEEEGRPARRGEAKEEEEDDDDRLAAN